MKRVCALLLLAASPVLAQPPVRDTARIVPLDSLQVDVTRGVRGPLRAPAAVSMLGTVDIQGTRLGISIDEALAAVPGVVVNNRYNFALGPRVAIRGFGTRSAFGVRGIRVIADGIPLTMPDGQTNLNNLDLGSAGSIEILRGPASAAWGNAAGGVILVRTEAPPASPFSAQMRAAIGDMGRGSDDLTNLRKFDLKVGGTQGDVDWLAHVTRLNVDGYREHAQGEVRLVNSRARWTPDDASLLTAVFGFADFPVANNPGSLPLDTARTKPTAAWPANRNTMSGEATRQVQGGLAYARALASGRLDVAVHALDRSLDNPLPFAYIRLDRKGGGVRVTWAGNLHNVGVSAGADVEAQSDDRREFANSNGGPGEARRDQTDRVTTVGPFLQLILQPHERIDVTAGARYDRVRFETDDAFLDDGRDDSGERTLSAGSWFAGVNVALAANVGAYGNLATSFQTPTTTELINAPPAAGEPCCPGGFNVDLDPQRARSIEAGVRASLNERVSLEATAFTMDIKDAIILFASIEGRDFFRNAAETRHRGIELAATLRAGPLRGSAAYAWSDFTFVDDGDPDESFEGNDVPGVSPHHLHLRGSVRLPIDAKLDLDLDHAAGYPTNDANTGPGNPAATVLDVRFSLRRIMGSVAIEPFLALQNVTDETYFSSVVVNQAAGRYYEPAPGRNVYLGVTIGTGGWGTR